MRTDTARTLRNELTWSVSRHQKFAECRRAYWFHYYGSWGGWEPEATPSQREIYILKQLGNRFTWAGTIVHAAIRGTLTAIRAKRPVDPDKVLQRVHRVMRQDFVSSREKRQWRDAIRRDFNGLIEHEYGDAVSTEAWHQSWLTVRDALQWFFDSKWPGLAQGLADDDWLEVDNQKLSESSHVVHGVKVFSVPDFAFRHQGRVHAIEWKTGLDERSHELQVVGSALFIARKHAVQPSDIDASVVFLSRGTQQAVKVDQPAIARFHSTFFSSLRAMQSMLANPKKNVAKSHHEFHPTANGALCARCPYRRPCQLTPPPPAGA